MKRYKVTYMLDGWENGKTTSKVTEFEVDPRIKSKFILHIDQWRSIIVLVEAKKWWEFWR